MALSSQDLVKGIDLTGVDAITHSQINQLVDAGRVGPSMGLVISTTDIALDTPEVPNPDAPLQGVTPTWWKRYKWLRKPYDSTGINLEYSWNDLLVSDPTFLKWQSSQQDVSIITAQVAALTTQLATTTNVASGAASNALTALTNASAAQAAANAAANSFVNLNSALIALFPVGSLRMTLGNEVYSKIVNQGFLFCDGSAISRTIFGGLFIAIGTTYGVGDGTTTFNLPDLRGRTLIGDGTGSGLTARTLGQTGGEEMHSLTGQESGIQSHQHVFDSANTVCTYGSGALANLPANGPNTGNRKAGTDNSGDVPAIAAHNNMQPFLVGRILIKT